MKQFHPKLSVGLDIALDSVLEFKVGLAVSQMGVGLQKGLVAKHISDDGLLLELPDDMADLELLHYGWLTLRSLMTADK